MFRSLCISTGSKPHSLKSEFKKLHTYPKQSLEEYSKSYWLGSPCSAEECSGQVIISRNNLFFYTIWEVEWTRD